MIGIILDLLSINDFYGVSEEIDIAKGKYELTLNLKKGIKQRKRWQRSKQLK